MVRRRTVTSRMVVTVTVTGIVTEIVTVTETATETEKETATATGTAAATTVRIVDEVRETIEPAVAVWVVDRPWTAVRLPRPGTRIEGVGADQRVAVGRAVPLGVAALPGPLPPTVAS